MEPRRYLLGTIAFEPRQHRATEARMLVTRQAGGELADLLFAVEDTTTTKTDAIVPLQNEGKGSFDVDGGSHGLSQILPLRPGRG